MSTRSGKKYKRGIAEVDAAVLVMRPPKRLKGMKGKTTKGPKYAPYILRLPAEMILEIVQYLEPNDLRSVASTMRRFHSILMEPIARFAWRASFENVGLPKCPDDLTEQAYAELLFGKMCTICRKKRAKTVHFVFRQRLCQPCFFENYEIAFLLTEPYPYWDDDEERKARNNKNGVIYKLVPHLSAYSRDYNESIAQNSIWQGHVWVAKSEFLEVLHQYVRLHDRKRKLHKFIETKKAQADKINKHALLVEDWLNKEKDKKEKEKLKIIKRRKRHIHTVLLHLGYTNHDLCNTDYRWLQLVEYPRALTQRTWKKILPKLEFYIQERREKSEIGVNGTDDHASHKECPDEEKKD